MAPIWHSVAVRNPTYSTNNVVSNIYRTPILAVRGLLPSCAHSATIPLNLRAIGGTMKRYFFVILFLLPSFAFAQPKITISKTKFNPGEQFTVEYSGGPALPASWIGVIPSKVPHGNDGTNGGSSISSQYTPQASGSAPFEAPPNPGSYDLRWSDGSEKELTSVTFEVIAVDYKAVLRPSKTSVNPGDEIELEYSVAIPLPKGAWIGLIPSSTPHGDENTNDQFDVAYFYANKLSDKLKFTAPEA